MNFLFFIPSLSTGKGGAERVASALGHAMRARGHGVAYAFNTTFNAGRLYYPVPASAPLLTFDASFLSQVNLRKKITALSPDLIVVFYASWYVVEYARLLSDLGIPLAFQECSNPRRVLTDNWLDASNAGPMRAEILGRAAGIRLTQPRYLASLPPELRERAEAFPNAFVRAERMRAHALRPKTILHVGGAKRNKNADAMLEAFALLEPRFPDWRLVMCTMRPPAGGFEPLKERIHSQFPDGRVSLHENVDDMAHFYQDARIHCITSLSEGLPNCVCEAMCQGTPSVGFAAAEGVNTLIRDGVDGLLADAGAPALAEALATLMADEARCEGLGAAAHAAAAVFSPDAVYDRWETFLKRSVERGRAMPPPSYPADPLAGRWEPADGATWAERLKRRAQALTGDVLFYGCGEIYSTFKGLFAHLRPVAMLVDSPDGMDRVDGLEVVGPAVAAERYKNLPVIIFSWAASILAHRLQTEYGMTGEMLTVDERAWQDVAYAKNIEAVAPDALAERRRRTEQNLPAYRVLVEPRASTINIESPDCAFCGSSDLLPYMTSQVVPWYEGAPFRLLCCNNCGLVFNSPRPQESRALGFVRENGEYFYRRKLDRPNVQAIHERMAAQFLSLTPGARDVFDVGFGAGTLLHAFRKLGLNASGNEVNDYAVRMLRAQGFDVTEAPTRQLPRIPRYDMVTMLDYLEHTYTPFDDLLTVHAMLRPGGMLHLKTLYLGCPSHAAKGELWQLFGMGHFYYFTPKVLEGMVRNAGFDLVDMRLENLVYITARKLPTTF